MSNFMKHIAKHGDRKACILFREVPNEDHMCLVIYPDVLPAPWEDAIMKVLESDMGQQAEQLADALHRSLLPDGRVILDTLHRERMIKKVRTADVIVTPRSDSSIRLDELNNILREMKTGEEAIKKMADLDKNAGLVGKREPKEVGRNPASRSNTPETSLNATIGDILTDDQLAAQRVAQAAKMKLEAQQMLAEAARLEAEAADLNTSTASNVPTKTTKAKATKKKQAA